MSSSLKRRVSCFVLKLQYSAISVTVGLSSILSLINCLASANRAFSVEVLVVVFSEKPKSLKSSIIISNLCLTDGGITKKLPLVI